MRIAVVGADWGGGVETVRQRLLMGLRQEGLDVEAISLGGYPPRIVLNDLSAIRKLRDFDVALYMAFPWPSAVVNHDIRTGIFVAGFLQEELARSLIGPPSLQKSALNLMMLSQFGLYKAVGSNDFVITQSRTTYERCGITGRQVLLPQFVFRTEFSSEHAVARAGSRDLFRVVTYTSTVDSPRLLTSRQLDLFAGILNKALTGRRLEFLIAGRSDSFEGRHSEHVGIMDRRSFLQLLASSDMYLESCIDEELRYTTLEAGILGVPVAKMTLPTYTGRQDYTSDEVILGESPSDLISKIVTFANFSEGQRQDRVEMFRRFLRGRRDWDSVKGPLLEAIRNVKA